ncbi:MAG TPA: hypothetical protein VK936_09430 [Longimicrobiales bacterium]|nr:hypothetical protein [Longimicrobiales bacterium]
MHAMILLLQDDGLTLGEVLRDIPHDPAAFVVYTLVVVFLWLIWKGSRGTKQG